MKPTYRRILIFVVAVVVLVGIFIGYSFFAASQRGKVPQEFSSARSQGAVISENIVSNSNDIAAALAKLSNTTSTYAKASSTLADVLTKVADVRTQAIELSATLSAMAKALPDIRSTEAQQAAFQSISQSTTMVSHLVTYTDEVKRLVAAIRSHLESHADNGSETSQLVQQINVEVAAINNSSKAAKVSMDQLDSLLR